MKKHLKNIFFFIFLFSIILSQSKVYGAQIPVHIGGRLTNNSTATVEVNGFSLYSDFSPYIHEDRTFVPIRELTELMGAKVEWHQNTQSVTISLNGEQVKLKTDSPIVYVNGTKKTLEKTSIPRLVKYQAPRQEFKTMVPLRFLSESFGFTVEWDQSSKLASIWNVEKPDVLSKPLTDETQPNEELAEKSEVVEVVKPGEGEVEVPEKPAQNADKPKGSKARVVIDAGHGGKDSGAVALDGKTREKDLALEVAKKLTAKLEAAGYEVINTRTSDTYPGLRDRANLSNQKDADIFISIHFNSFGSSSAQGIEVLYASEDNVNIKSGDQTVLARLILNELIKDTGMNNRGIKNRPDLAVLRLTETDAALVELGFLSNQGDFNKIMSNGYLDKFAQSIFKGVVAYDEQYL